MPDHIADGRGNGFPWGINGSNAGFVAIDTANPSFGYTTNQIIRKNAGSGTPESFVFSSQAEAFSIENLGSVGVYFKFDGTADTGSTSGFLEGIQFRSFDAKVGSVSFLGSGGTTSFVQCVRLT